MTVELALTVQLSPQDRAVLQQLANNIGALTKGMNKMADTVADLDKAIADLGTEEGSEAAAVQAIIAALQAKGNPDLTAEVTALQAVNQHLTDNAAAINTAINPPPA